MKLMSFALTVPQMKARTKSVTRRNGWRHAKAGDVVLAVEKARGVRVEDRKSLYPIRFVHVYEERLDSIAIQDVIEEGFPCMTTEDFITMYRKANRCNRDQIVTVIAFMPAKEPQR